MSVPLTLSRIHFPVTTLGPGRRIGVWFQGCSIRCPGCISMDTWAPNKGVTDVGAVFDAIEPFVAEADGLTVSGGEPFDQPAALRALLEGWRARHSGDILVYSGHPLETLEPALDGMLGLIDALLCDPLEIDLPQTLALRGSDNQRLLLLSPLGERVFGGLDQSLANSERRFDIMFDDELGTVFLAGIPQRGDLVRLSALLTGEGHQSEVTEERHRNR
jgi:anaerobic ribonucleoside-triphosphate reductase activating protein